MKGSNEGTAMDRTMERKRLAFIGQVLHYAQKKGVSVREAYRNGDRTYIDNPFPSLKAFERFLERKRGEVGEVASKFSEFAALSEAQNRVYEGEPTEGASDAPHTTEGQLLAALERQDRQLSEEQRDFLRRTLQSIRQDRTGQVAID